MTTATETATAELTTYCTCEVWDEETDTCSPANDCSDWCFQDAEDYATELVSEWMDARDLGDYEQVIIYGTRLGWRSLSGYKLCPNEPRQIVRALYLNGDFTLTFSLTPEGKLTATRQSHDEYGAGFEFDTVQVCAGSECMETEGLKLNKYAQPNCAWCLEISNCN